MGWRAVVQHRLRKKGYEFVRYPIVRFLRRFDISVVLDVGANIGQYATDLRKLGYDKRIVSFEPLSSAFAELETVSAADPQWQAVRLALGRTDGESTIRVASNSVSSSFLEVLREHVRAAPESRTVCEERVPIRRLDGVFAEHCSSTDNVFLKIDVQGFEREVVEGATGVVSRLAGLQIEMALVPLYAGETLVEDMIAFARSHGFVPYWFGHGLRDPSSQQLLQVDGLFFRGKS